MRILIKSCFSNFVVIVFWIISGIPTLVILDGEGNMITDNGRGKVSKDPEGKVSTQAMGMLGL